MEAAPRALEAVLNQIFGQICVAKQRPRVTAKVRDLRDDRVDVRAMSHLGTNGRGDDGLAEAARPCRRRPKSILPRALLNAQNLLRFAELGDRLRMRRRFV